MPREPKTREELERWLNEQLGRLPECEGVQVQIQALQPAGDWSVDTITLGSGGPVGLPRCVERLQKIVSESQRLFALHE